jgi:hypothetical protein
LSHLVIRALAWLFPAPPLEEVTSDTFGTLSEKYRSRVRWGNLIAFLAFITVAVYYYFLFSLLGSLITQRFADVKYVVHRNEVEYGMMAFLLSLVSSTYLYLLAFRWFLGRKEYDIYMAYAGLCLYGMDAGKTFKWFFLLTFPPLVVLCLLWTTTFTAVTAKAMLDAPFGSFGVTTERPYSDVRNIYFARKFHTRNEDNDSPRYVIVFKDGYRWQTESVTTRAELNEQTEIVRYFAEQSRRPIVTVEFIENIP